MRLRRALAWFLTGILLTLVFHFVSTHELRRSRTYWQEEYKKLAYLLSESSLKAMIQDNSKLVEDRNRWKKRAIEQGWKDE